MQVNIKGEDSVSGRYVAFVQTTQPKIWQYLANLHKDKTPAVLIDNLAAGAMGRIVELHCECGYTRGSLYVGCGRDRLQGERELFQCRRCYHVILSKTWRLYKQCSKCGGMKLDKIDEHDQALVLACPSCLQHRLQVEFCGLWD